MLKQPPPPAAAAAADSVDDVFMKSSSSAPSDKICEIVTDRPHQVSEDGDDDDEEKHHRCRYCHAPSSRLITDWAQGDRVCSNCGIVDDDHLLESRPEWRNTADGNNDDTAQGNATRCGLVPNDENKYWGGLEPTTLSSQVFGGGSSSRGGEGGSMMQNSHAYRKRLLATQRRIEKMLQQEHVRSMKDAKLAQDLLEAKKNQLWKNYDDDDEDDDDEFHTHTMDSEVRPDYDQLLLREEEQAQRVHATLYASKWSLDRALLLHSDGDGNDASTINNFRPQQEQEQQNRDELWRQLDKTLRQASADIYQAYTMLTSAAQRLELPQSVTREALQMLCRYATKRDGLFVKGVSSRIVSFPTAAAANNNNFNTTAITKNRQSNRSTTTTTAYTARTRRRRSDAMNDTNNNDSKDMAQRLREYNKLKQAGSLCSALLFLTARNMGWTRSLAEVCDSFQGIYQTTTTADVIVSTNNNNNNNHPKQTALIVDDDDDDGDDKNRNPNRSDSAVSVSFIKPKHCSRAMAEIRKIFPDFCRSVVVGNGNNNNNNIGGHSVAALKRTGLKHAHDNNNGAADMEGVDEELSTSNFLSHALRKLQLPPVAEESIRTLVRHCRREQVQLGRDSGTKLSTLSASITFFVCVAGAAMQRLAEQGRSASTATTATTTFKDYSIPRKRPATRDVSSSSSSPTSSSKQVPAFQRKRLASQLVEQSDYSNIRKRRAKAEMIIRQQDEPQERHQQPAHLATTTTNTTTTTTKDFKDRSDTNKQPRNAVKVEESISLLFDDPMDKTESSITPPNVPTESPDDEEDNEKKNRVKRKRAVFKTEDSASLFDDPVDKKELPKLKKTKDKQVNDSKNKSNIDDPGTEPFDVFSHPAVVSLSSDMSERRQAYEMRRMWDTWTEQMSWTRSLGEIEHSCGVSKSVILEAYKSKLYPRRLELLSLLQKEGVDTKNKMACSDSATTSSSSLHRTLATTPLAPTLLSHITAAAPLLKNYFPYSRQEPPPTLSATMNPSIATESASLARTFAKKQMELWNGPSEECSKHPKITLMLELTRTLTWRK